MATKIPAFSYTGQYRTEMRGGYWYIYLLTTGMFQMTYAKSGVDACVVGGGASGEAQAAPPHGDRGMPGGNGGTVVNQTGRSIAAGQAYHVVIGAGGANPPNSTFAPGGASSIFDIYASGGSTPTGQGTGWAGANGTHAFGDASLPRYGAQGGAGGKDFGGSGGNGGADGGGKGANGGGPGSRGADATAGAINTGSGGGGAGSYYFDDDSRFNAWGGNAAPGGSGIVILRGTQDDNIPVVFNGTHLSEIVFNGVKLTGLIYNGTRIFARAMQRIARPFRRIAPTPCRAE